MPAKPKPKSSLSTTVTLAILHEAINRLRVGTNLYLLAEELGVDVDALWQVVRHYGYFGPRGQFYNDVDLPPLPVARQAA